MDIDFKKLRIHEQDGKLYAEVEQLQEFLETYKGLITEQLNQKMEENIRNSYIMRDGEVIFDKDVFKLLMKKLEKKITDAVERQLTNKNQS